MTQQQTLEEADYMPRLYTHWLCNPLLPRKTFTATILCTLVKRMRAVPLNVELN